VKLLLCILMSATAGIYTLSRHTYAQEVLDMALHRFYFEHKWQFDTLTYHDTRDDLIILHVGQNVSKSFSYFTFRSDSLRATPDGDRVLTEMINIAVREAMATGERFEFPYHRRSTTMVYKNYPRGHVTVTDGFGGNHFQYSDYLHPQQWILTDSTKTIMGYTCQMAVSVFRGRRWIAWFAPDIPISDGPWKLSGLPGLIMEAYDEKKHFHFKLVGIKNVENDPIIFSPVVLSATSFGRYENTSRIPFLRGLFEHLHNMPAIMNEQLGIDTFDENPKHRRHHCFKERDFR